jgi:Putative Actinobacterial Holin-X, holin superfamily III
MPMTENSRTEARAEASATWSALGAAISGTWREARTLVDQHLSLASREAAARTAGMGIDVMLMLVAVLCVQGALLSGLAAVGFAVYAAGAAAWLAALIAAALAAAIGIVAALAGRRRFVQRTRPPSPTLLALRETGDWLRDTAESLRS